MARARSAARDRPSPYGPRKEYGEVGAWRGPDEGKIPRPTVGEGVREDREQNHIVGKKCRFYTANDVIIFPTTN